MPNYIKNRIELLGDEKQVKEMIEKFSTHFEREPRRAFDGRLVYNKIGDEWGVGWYDEKTGEFEERKKPKINHIPDNFKQDFNEAWTRFPDFEKIVKMPESLNISSDGFLMPLENQFSVNTQMKAHLDKIRDFCRENKDRGNDVVDNFLLGVKNYIEHGHATWYSWAIENWGTKWNTSDCESKSDTIFEFTTAWKGVPQLIQKMSEGFPEVVIKYEYADEDTGYNCGQYEISGGHIIDAYLPDGGTKEAYELAFKLRPECANDFQLVDGAYEYVDDES